MKIGKIIIGSRGSKLALIYAEKAKDALKNVFNGNIEIKKISTTGDQNQNERLSEIGGKGLFSKNIELQLIEKKIDIAVHALKDMPSFETKGLYTGCFLKRNYSNEILISKNNIKFDKLKPKSIVGTSSLRREYQLKRKRNDLIFKLIRGNVDTRIKKLKEGTYDAIILSKAGIDCLKLNDQISEEFLDNDIIPSAGQGIIAIQCRQEDSEMIDLLKKINDEKTKMSALAEKEVLKTLDGDCDTAIGVSSVIKDKTITIEAELFSIDGKKRYYIKSEKELKLASELGKEMGKILKERSKGSYKN
jgi:hydroxymethylbilane synthase|tara:strand:+ start:410 stop:1321 length:912 start_codon:yes stop_codon:yes gene_type:complete